MTRNAILTNNAVRYRTAGNGTATDLTCNWWGADASPGYAGSAPWLTTSNLNGPCIGGNPPTISIADLLVKEGNSGMTPANVPVTLDHTYPSPVSVKYATAIGGAPTAKGRAAPGTDYVTKTGTVTFPANTTSATIPLQVNGGTTLEQNETFLVNLSNPTNGVLTMDQSGTVTIGNDELPEVVVKGVPSAEGTATPFTITLKQTFWTTLNLNAATVGNTAASPGDFIAVNTTVSFPLGNVGPKTVNVTVKTDGLQEPGETFYLQLNGGSAPSMGQSRIKAEQDLIRSPSDRPSNVNRARQVLPAGPGRGPG